MKVWVILFALMSASSAFAFNSLSCHGDLDVRLKGPDKKKEKTAQSFTIKREDALELDLSVEGLQIGHLFPWDHVVWEPDVALYRNFKDVKFKTDDEKIISISVFDIAHKKAHKFDCELNFD